MIARAHGLISAGEDHPGPVMLREVIARLAAAGILPDDPGLAAWREHNRAAYRLDRNWPPAGATARGSAPGTHEGRDLAPPA
jgi:hypothetical protein